MSLIHQILRWRDVKQMTFYHICMGRDLRVIGFPVFTQRGSWGLDMSGAACSLGYRGRVLTGKEASHAGPELLPLTQGVERWAAVPGAARRQGSRGGATGATAAGPPLTSRCCVFISPLPPSALTDTYLTVHVWAQQPGHLVPGCAMCSRTVMPLIPSRRV